MTDSEKIEALQKEISVLTKTCKDMFKVIKTIGKT